MKETIERFDTVELLNNGGVVGHVPPYLSCDIVVFLRCDKIGGLLYKWKPVVFQLFTTGRTVVVLYNVIVNIFSPVVKLANMLLRSFSLYLGNLPLTSLMQYL